jgi:hypothetical protein
MPTVAPVDILQGWLSQQTREETTLTDPVLSDAGAADCVGNEVSMELELELEEVKLLVVETAEVDVVVTIGT